MKQKLIPKKQEGAEINYKDFLDLLPIYGTVRSGQKLIENPTFSNAGSFALDLGGDLLTAFGVGYLGKTKKAAKLANKMRNIQKNKVNNAVQNVWNLKNKRDKYKHAEKQIEKYLYETYNKQLQNARIASSVENDMLPIIERLYPYPKTNVDIPLSAMTNPGWHAASKKIELLNNNNK